MISSSPRVTRQPRPRSGETARLRIGFVLVPRFTLTAFAGFVDALRLAADVDDRSRQIDCEWRILGQRSKPVAASCGASVQPWAPMEQPEQYDYIVVVGGLMHGGQVVQPGLYRFLQAAARVGVPLIGLCTGSFVLARAGLLDGYECCVSWFHRSDFEAEFPRLRVQSERLFVVDRDRLTCAGGTSVVHLAAYVIERHVSRSHAIKSLRILLEDAPLPANAAQPESVVTQRAHDGVVRRAMLLIEQHLGDALELREVLRPLRIGMRQIERRFHDDVGIGPREYRLRLRLARARWLLEHTERPVTSIGLECGFVDGSHFARTFRRRCGMRPSKFRRTEKPSD
jgi:transcriptional regulator GlxA family with amidase domain